MNKKDIIVCRCEDITLEELHRMFERGYTTFEEVKRQLRVGMGPCQGQTCGEIIQREIAKYFHQDIEKVALQKTRPLTTGVKLNAINKGSEHES